LRRRRRRGRRKGKNQKVLNRVPEISTDFPER